MVVVAAAVAPVSTSGEVEEKTAAAGSGRIVAADEVDPAALFAQHSTLSFVLRMLLLQEIELRCRRLLREV